MAIEIGFLLGRFRGLGIKKGPEHDFRCRLAGELLSCLYFFVSMISLIRNFSNTSPISLDSRQWADEVPTVYISGRSALRKNRHSSRWDGQTEIISAAMPEMWFALLEVSSGFKAHTWTRVQGYEDHPIETRSERIRRKASPCEPGLPIPRRTIWALVEINDLDQSCSKQFQLKKHNNFLFS